MIPLRDEYPSRQTPYITYGLIAVNILVYIWEMLVASDPYAQYMWALVPSAVTDGIDLFSSLTIFTSMFMHGGLAHIGGNMLYLWIFGDNIEERLGHGKFLAFYLLGGFAASVVHILTNPNSQIPTVGASGAIAAVLGAYLILYPQNRVLTLIWLGFFIRMSMIPSRFVLGFWFVLQLFQGLISLGGPDVGGVAFWAHIGGFVFGLVIARLLGQTHVRSPYEDMRGRWY